MVHGLQRNQLNTPGCWMQLALLSVCLLLCAAQQCAADGAFLQEQLPLKVLVTTPTSIATYTAGGAAIQVTGRQAITAVFSRPVIALGSDWGSKELPATLVPFKLSCSIPGRLRWVTTNIARFDPAVEWPTDLDCSFDWNTQLTTFDGAPLTLDSLQPSVPLATQPLAMQVQSVSSKAAVDATDDQWSATMGLPDDKLPEVPPDANITMSFSYPVEFTRLAAALKVTGPGGSGQTITVSPCLGAVPPALSSLVYDAKGAASITVGAGDITPQDLLKLNGTCAVVKIVPGLGAGAAAALRLPVGSRYSSVAGPVGKDTDAQVFGLRPFRIPLTWDFQNITDVSQSIYSGVKFRRLTMWLPHGLAPNTQLSALKPLITICTVIGPFNQDSPCMEQAFELSRPSKGSLVAAVPSLAPRQRYRVSIKGDAAVKDAFGLPLQASANTWWTMELDANYEGPNMNQVALLEVASGNSSLSWPWVSRGKPEAGVDKVQAWGLQPDSSSNSEMARAVSAMSYSYSGVPSDAFGQPDVSIARSTSTAPTFQSLSLPGKAGVHFVGSCCSDRSWPTPRKVFSSNLLVVQSNLQAAFVAQDGKVVAWITTTQGASKPVEGAKVQVFLSKYGQDFASAGPSCTTAADGTCNLDLSSGDGGYDGTVKSALITAEGEGPLVVPSLPVGYSGPASKYAGAIVLDRKVVKPGDDLHVTAYIQQRVGSKLEVAKDLTSVILQVNPGFDSSSSGGVTRLTLPVDATFGSVHATIPVPSNATAASYTMQLYTATKPADGAAISPGRPILMPISLASAVAEPPAAVEAVEEVPPDGVVPPKLLPAPAEVPGEFITGTDFTVSDPRPPTASLSLTAPNWVRPKDTVKISLKAESYIGSDVSDAEMTVDWDTGKATGSLKVKTNAQGVAEGTIELGKLPAANVSEPGAELSLTATWIGPTREAITQSKTIKIADGPIRVQLLRTLNTDVPGMKFGVKADAFSNEDDSPVTGAAIEVTLLPANGTASLTNCSSAQLASLAEQKCSIKSGDPRAAALCQLVLPCMGDFELKGCVEGSCGTPVRLGRNATWWKASPWSSMPQINLLADRVNVSIGGEVKLAVQNPFWGAASGLLVWGNAVKRVVKALPQVPPGASTITISGLGEECRGSCRLVLLLAVARTPPPAVTSAVQQMTRFVTVTRNSFPFSVFISIPALETAGSGSGAESAAKSLSFQSTTSSNAAAAANAAMLAAATATVRSFELPSVPTSALFDPLAPQTVSAEITLQGPKTEALSVDVSVVGQSKTSDGVAVLAPKSGDGSIKVAVKDSTGNAVPGAEVTLLVVDKAFLDLMPYPLQDVRSAIAPDLATVFSIIDLNAFRTSRAAIYATFSTLQRRLTKQDPWLPVDTQVTPRGFIPGDFISPPMAAAVDIPDATYLASYTTPITPIPSRVCAWGQACPVLMSSPRVAFGMPMMAAEAVASDAAVGSFVAAVPAPAPAPAMAKGGARATAANNNLAPKSGAGASAKSAAGGTELRMQQEFKVTALFTLIKGTADGSATAKFTAPDNLGQFVVRAYAAAPKPATVADPVGVVYGAGESKLVVRRSVSLTPSLPRQVRAGDNFTAGVLVDAPGVMSDTAVTVTASLVAPTSGSGNPLALNGPASITVTVAPGKTQQEVRFNFRARGLGTQNITFAAKAAGGDTAAADNVQLEVPVLGKQAPVWIATSFAVRGSNSTDVANRVEGLALPRAENGSGSVNLVAGVGYLPAVQGTYEALVRQGLDAYRDCPSGSTAVALSVLPAMLALYRPASTPPSSWLTTNQVDTTTKAMQQAASLLTDATYGLLQFEPRCLYPYSKGPERADIDLNAWATFLVEQLQLRFEGGKVAQGLASGWGSLATATKTWRKALEAQLVADAVAARSAQPPREYADLDTLSWARLVLGSSWQPSGVSAEVQKDLSMERLVAAAVNMSVGGQARVGLTLLDSQSAARSKDSKVAGTAAAASGEVAKITQRLLSNVRVGGRTAYVATGDGERGAASLSDQSLALMLFLRSGTDNPLIQKVAAWVGQGAAPPLLRFSAICVSSSPWEAALRSRALSFYDNATDSTTPNLGLTVVAAAPGSNAGSTPLLSARFNTSNAGSVARSSTKWDKIPSGSNLVFNAKGSGEVSIAASLNFTPAELLPFPTYRGLWVQRIVQLSSREGGSLQGVGLGKLVTVAVQVTSPDDQSDVVVEVLMPGGLEPLDPNVYKDADLATICSSSEDESDLSAPVLGGGGGVVYPMAVAGSSVVGPRVSSKPFVSVSRSVGVGAADGFAVGAADGFASPYRPSLWWRPWPVCPVQTTTPAVVTFSFSYFRAGTQTIRFKAISATSGVFSLPPVKAYVQQQPEVMGLSPAGVFTVCPTAADCPAAQQLLAADPAAKACPGDCSGNGACNLSSGVCICDAGFSGPDCGTFSSTRR